MLRDDLTPEEERFDLLRDDLTPEEERFDFEPDLTDLDELPELLRDDLTPEEERFDFEPDLTDLDELPELLRDGLTPEEDLEPPERLTIPELSDDAFRDPDLEYIAFRLLEPDDLLLSAPVTADLLVLLEVAPLADTLSVETARDGALT